MKKYKQILLIILAPIVGIPLLFIGFIFLVMGIFLVARVFLLPSGHELNKIYQENQAIFQEIGKAFDENKLPENKEEYEKKLGASGIHLNQKAGEYSVAMGHIGYSFDSGESVGYFYHPLEFNENYVIVEDMDAVNADKNCRDISCTYYQKLENGWYIRYTYDNYP